MVSLKKIFGLLFINSVKFLCFMGLYGIACSQVDTSITVLPDRPGITIRDCVSGKTQNKYTASGCSYTTQKRTCCYDGTWSGWDEECKACEDKNPCSSDADCCDGKSCVNVTNGGLLTLEKVCGIQCSESSKPTCSLSFGSC